MTLAKIERWIWYIFLATLAWQTRIILWQADLAFIEWRSISLYGSDMLMVTLFAIALWYRPQLRIDRIDQILIGFLVVAGISIVRTDQLTVSLYQWARLVQFAGLFWYVRYYALRRFDADTSLTMVVLGALLQSGLALAQYLLQHDIGLRWFGETLLTTTMPGVAVFYDLAHTKILRAYGTLPHPNVLAAYLMTALWAGGYLYLRHGRNQKIFKFQFSSFIWGISGVLMLWALYATYSRTMIAIWLAATTVLGVLIWHRVSASWPNITIVQRRMREAVILALVVSAVFAAVSWREVAARAAISSQEEAVTLRVYYAKAALESGGSSLYDVNWTGVGIGNFVSWLKKSDPGKPSWVYQPAHNLYLLVYSEIGLLGVGLFLTLIFFILRHAIWSSHRPGVVRWGLVTIVAAFLAVALFDHFFWTLQQGRILFWMVLALAATA